MTSLPTWSTPRAASSAHVHEHRRIEEESLTMGTTEIDLPTWKKWNKGYLTGNVG
jgi:hypothetical protein